MSRLPILIVMIIITSSITGCLSAENGEEQESHLVYWEEVHLDKGGIFSEHPLHRAMDMEYITGSEIVLISEWPRDDDQPPVISTWRFGGVMEKIGQIPLPERGEVVYSGSSQCGIKLAVPPGSMDSVIISRCMSNTSVAIEKYGLDSDGLLISNSRETLLNLDTGNTWGSFEHLLGEIEFGHEGDLWVFMGYGNMDNTSQDPMSPFGGVLRLTLDENGLNPSIENPYLNNDSWNPLVYAKGLRMPWTAAQDQLGNWWIGEVGEFQYERVQLLDAPAKNFGYFKHTWISPGNISCVACSSYGEEIIRYSRENDHRFMIEDTDSYESFYAAIWVGGVLPEHPEIPNEFQNSVIFGDFTRGFVRSYGIDSGGNTTHIGHLTGVVDLEFHEGGMYALATGIQTAKESQNPGIWRMVFL